MEVIQFLILFVFLMAGIGGYFFHVANQRKIANFILEEAKCPKCKDPDVAIGLQSNGCSGTATLTAECKKCGFECSCTVPNGGGSCGI